MKLELPLRSRFDEFADLISVTGSGLEDGEDDEFRRTLLQFAVQHPGIYICHNHVCYSHASSDGNHPAKVYWMFFRGMVPWALVLQPLTRCASPRSSSRSR